MGALYHGAWPGERNGD